MDICTNDNRFLTIRTSGTEDNQKYELISYDTDDGSVSQRFTLAFRPGSRGRGSICNDNYLALMDIVGHVHIYKYTHIDPQPDP